jgi:hypothetical protein
MSKHHVREARRQIQRILETLEHLTEPKLHELDGKARYGVRPDGYPTATIPDGPRSTEPTSSVERAALQRAEHHQPADTVGDAIRDIFRHIRHMSDLAVSTTRELQYVDHVGHKAAGRISSLAGACQACYREIAGGTADPMRSGYCSACYAAWVRAGRPERPAWERARRQWLETQRAS